MSESMSILEKGKVSKWRVELANAAVDAGECIYQQRGLGMQTIIVHACRNMGNPIDQAAHAEALRIFEGACRLPRRPENAKRWNECVDNIRWEAKRK
jgi:hypothetical protein